LQGLAVVTGGRSSGARVACRCSGDGVARAVLCLAFPLLPPGKDESKSRLPELDGVAVPVLVVQGRSDRFGMPPEAPGRQVVTLAGTHALRSEEHTSELQSRFDLVCRRLLDKTKHSNAAADQPTAPSRF